MLRAVGYKLLPVVILSIALNSCELVHHSINDIVNENQPASISNQNQNQNQTVVVTKAQYDQIQNNMLLSEVERIIGKPGQSADTSFSIPGSADQPGVNSKQTYYQWVNPDGSLMIAVFVDDKLVFKSQLNLK